MMPSYKEHTLLLTGWRWSRIVTLLCCPQVVIGLPWLILWWYSLMRLLFLVVSLFIVMVSIALTLLVAHILILQVALEPTIISASAAIVVATPIPISCSMFLLEIELYALKGSLFQ